MFDEPEETPEEKVANPAQRAKEKADEFRVHAELAAVFEGVRKFDAEILSKLDAATARDVQQRIGKLEKAKSADSPLLPKASASDASATLNLPATLPITTNDYHVHRRPGEVMIIRWLDGEQVDQFYDRMQAHFDAAMNAHKEDERQATEWKQDETATAYLAELDKVSLKMADRYLRNEIRQHKLFVLSTQVADEMNIAYLCDYVMGLPAADIVGPANAPPDNPTEQDLTWFFKRFSLRGIVDGVEKMCFFTYLQKSEDDYDFGE